MQHNLNLTTHLNDDSLNQCKTFPATQLTFVGHGKTEKKETFLFVNLETLISF